METAPSSTAGSIWQWKSIILLTKKTRAKESENRQPWTQSVARLTPILARRKKKLILTSILVQHTIHEVVNSQVSKDLYRSLLQQSSQVLGFNPQQPQAHATGPRKSWSSSVDSLAIFRRERGKNRFVVVDSTGMHERPSLRQQRFLSV